MQPDLSRRHFFRVSALAGGGLMLDMTLPLGECAQAAARVPATINAFVSIDRKGLITIRARNPEMGQGVKTALPMMIAEELDADWTQVQVEQADFNTALYGPQSAGASTSVPQAWQPMRQMGAAARDLLVRAAAQRWKVPPEEITTSQGRLLHAPSRRSLPYGALAEAAARLPAADPATLRFKTPERYTILGTPRKGPDTPRITRGQPLYGIDTRRPGMLYAVFVGPPAHGARLRHAELTAAQAMPGVKHVVQIAGVRVHGGFADGADSLTDGVAIVATNWWLADQARAKLTLDWDVSACKGHGDVAYKAKADALFAAGPGKTAFKEGDAEAAMAKAAHTLSARYDYPFLAHMTMEPQNCTALWQDDHLEVWAPCQQPRNGAELTAKTLGLKPEAVTLHMTRIGGGFGRRLMSDYIAQAGAIARAVPGVPVQLLYNRTDDIRHDFYRPAGWHEFSAGLDEAGRLIAFKNHFVSFGPKDDPQFFANMAVAHFPEGLVPDLLMTHSVFPTVMPLGAMRAPTSNAHAFVFQSFLDEAARAGGRDLPALTLDLLSVDKSYGEANRTGQPEAAFNTLRARAVVEKVLDMAAWEQSRAAPRQAGTGRGFAFYFCHKGYFAEVVEVSVKGKAITVRKVWAAGDIGQQIINPLGAEAQVKGSILDGLSQVLDGQKVTVTDGAIQQSNFHDYRFARISRRPEIEIAFVPSAGMPSGLGEPALPPVIPALGNAIFDATGTRLRSMPFQL